MRPETLRQYQNRCYHLERYVMKLRAQNAHLERSLRLTHEQFQARPKPRAKPDFAENAFYIVERAA